MINPTLALSGERMAAELAGLVGPDNVAASGVELQAFQSPWLAPVAAVAPGDLGQAAEVVRWARETRTPLVPWGAGTKQNRGNVGRTEAVVLSTRRLDRIVEIEDANLTAEVEAGLPLIRFQEELARRGLFLPLDPADMEQATVGGTFATNSSGPHRFLYRTGRDLVLGLRVVMPSGETATWGGKAIKNVAGYDVRKLIVGSWGTMGLIGSVVVRLFPRPMSHGVMLSSFDTAEGAWSAVKRLLLAPQFPAAIDLLAGEAVATSGLAPAAGGFLLMVGLEGHKEAVDRLVRDVGAWCREDGAASVEFAAGDDGDRAWQARRRAELELKQRSPDVTCCRVGARIDAVAPLYRQALDVCRGRDLSVGVVAHAGTGVARVIIGPAAAGEHGRVVEAIEEVRRTARGHGGYLVVEQAPPEVMSLAGSAPIRDDYGLMGRLRETLDPGRIFNPGRSTVW